MLDVKTVVSGATNVFVFGSGLLVALAIWAWIAKWKPEFLKGLERGAMLLLGLIGLVILSVLILFQYIFVLFHQIFFASGTWSFLYSDTLIRLFPERFWQDTFLMVGGLSISLGLLIYFGARKTRLKMSKT
jgi:integral membrane protein (TIGR01906 family)